MTPRRPPEDGKVNKCTSNGDYAGCVQWNAKQKRWLAINHMGAVLGSFVEEGRAAGMVLDTFSKLRRDRKRAEKLRSFPPAGPDPGDEVNLY